MPKYNKEIKTGLFVIVILTLFIWGFNFLKGKNLLFTESKYYAIYSKVDGLVSSNPVFINGVKVGLIRNVEFISPQDSRILVTFTLNSDLEIPKNSIARIYSSDIMGSRALQIVYGNSKELIKPGDTLQSEIEGDLKEEINKQVLPLKMKAEGMISSIDTVLIAFKLVFNETTRRNLAASFENIKLTLDNLKHTTFNVDTLVSTQRNRMASIISNVESITYNIRQNNDKITHILTNFSTISDTLARVNIATTIQKANDAITSIADISEKINKGQGTLGQLVNNDSLYIKLESASKNLDKLVEDIRLRPYRYLSISVFGRKRD